MPLTYTIQHTHAGDYLIRDQADRQLARFAGETEAAAWITQRQAADAAEAAEREMHERAQAAFDESMPDLNKLQLRWQRWRNWLYDALSQESRRLSATPSVAHSPRPHAWGVFVAKIATRFLRKGLDSGCR